ncbi:nose resistant to fluoxetine protein 6-like [Drosophila madeirensis]|uniref:Nose resistant to fluoxetine protein 6-like n=1 Tax=Drosophila madeirensis TaxID=30013 RepID=A0AAU9FWB8_DROMD
MHGFGGLANSFLSSPLWQPLSKLSYSAYIFHMFIKSFNGGITRTNTYFSDYQMMLRFWSDFGFTLLLAFLMYILIEEPFGNLQSHLLQTRKSSSKSEGDARLKTTVFEGPTNELAPGPNKEETPATCYTGVGSRT